MSVGIVKNLEMRVKKLKKLALLKTSPDRQFYGGKSILAYRDDPQGYAKNVLQLDPGLTPDQLSLCTAFSAPPYRVICRAGHVVGKSFLCAFLVSWIYDTRPECFIITTAPKLESVRDIVWRELRKLRSRAGLGGFPGPRSLRLESSPRHVAVGITALNATAFQGKHEVAVYIFIDEAAGVDAEFWVAAETMLSGQEYGLFAILNPTTTACFAYKEEQSGHCTIKALRSIDHPNIEAELKGLVPPYPSAVRLATLRLWIKKWCDVLGTHDTPNPDSDFQFPPPNLASKRDPSLWYRPGPIGEARILGRYPTRGVNTVWNEALFSLCCRNAMSIEEKWRTAIGVDVARYGDDMTEIVVRRGPCVVHHEAHSGWNGKQIANRVKELCHEFHGPEDERLVRVFIDETGGWGTGVIDNADDFNFIGVNSGSAASDKTLHYNMRSELWFSTLEIARQGLVDLSRLHDENHESCDELRRQLLAQKYVVKPSGQLWVVDKDKIKEELKRSPDTADAFNLCFLTDYQGRIRTEGVIAQ